MTENYKVLIALKELELALREKEVKSAVDILNTAIEYQKNGAMELPTAIKYLVKEMKAAMDRYEKATLEYVELLTSTVTTLEG